MIKKILGTVQLGMPYGINNGLMPDRGSALELLEYAYDSGIRYLDTARAYGESLEVIGDYHQKNPNKKFHVFSKFMLSDLDDSLDELIQKQCQTLRTECLEGLYFHRFEEYKSSSELIRACKLKNLMGVSVYSVDELLDISNDPNISNIQISMSIFHHHSKDKLRFNQKRSPKNIYIRSIYLQGLLFLPYEKLTGSLLSFVPLREYIDNLALRLKMSKEMLAAAYIMDLKNIDGVLFGAETIKQINETNKNLKHSVLDWDELLKDMPRLEDESLLNPGNWK